MDGYRLIFSTIRGRKHKNMQLYEWLVEKAKELGFQGVTVIEALEGYGRDKNIHSANFFELVDEPLEIIMLSDEERCDKLFEAIRVENISIFYAKIKAKYGFTL